MSVHLSLILPNIDPEKHKKFIKKAKNYFKNGIDPEDVEESTDHNANYSLIVLDVKPKKHQNVVNAINKEYQSISAKPSRGRGRPRKVKQEDQEEEEEEIQTKSTKSKSRKVKQEESDEDEDSSMSFEQYAKMYSELYKVPHKQALNSREVKDEYKDYKGTTPQEKERAKIRSIIWKFIAQKNELRDDFLKARDKADKYTQDNGYSQSVINKKHDEFEKIRVDYQLKIPKMDEYIDKLTEKLKSI